MIESTHNEANRLRSAVEHSMAPTPTAASPFKGKNPCKAMIAVLTPHAGCHDSIMSL